MMSGSRDQPLTQFAAQNPTKTQRPWQPIDVREMKVFVGMLILMGISVLPRLEMYWTTQHALIHPNLNELMSQKRFEQILRYLHLNNSENQIARGQVGFDVLFKVRFSLPSPCF